MYARLGLLAATITVGACSLLADDQVEQVPLSQNSEGKHFGFATLPPLANKGGDALRVVIQPSFGRYHYRFDFLPMKAGCKIVDIDIDDMTEVDHSWCYDFMANGIRTDIKGLEPMVAFRFVVPAQDFRELFDNVKYRMKKWPGSHMMSTDGTSVALELHNRGKISSINSNGHSPDNPSAIASIHVKALALAYGPPGIFPRSGSWHAKDSSEWPCANPGLSTEDADGFGIGDDPCAVWLKTKPAKK